MLLFLYIFLYYPLISLYVVYTDPPTIRTQSQQDIKEGSQLIVNCTATPGNPSSTTFYWTKVDNPGFRQNGSTLQFYNIQRNSSGTYRCTAENNYNNGVKGTHSQAMEVDVLCEIFFYLIRLYSHFFACCYNILNH